MREANRKAFKAAKDALGLAKRSDNKQLMGTANIHVTRCHLTNGRLDKAMLSSQEALDNLREVNDRQQEAIALALNAEVLMVQKEFEKAEAVAKRAMSIAQSARDSGAENYARAVLDGIYEADAASKVKVALPDAPVAAVTAEVGVASAEGPAAPTAVATLNLEEVTATVLALAKDVVGEADDLALDVGLMDAGMDSLSAVAFRNSLMRQIKGVNLPASLMFDYPTINHIADYIIEETSK
jgi:tetratricopeptide (TPR) repeat protein